MPLTLAGLQQEAQPFAVEFAGEKLSGTYRPNAFTPELEDLITGADESKTRSRSFLEAVAKVLASWDLLDKPGGKPWPISADQLAVIPSALLVAILRTVAEAQSPNPTTSGS